MAIKLKIIIGKLLPNTVLVFNNFNLVFNMEKKCVPQGEKRVGECCFMRSSQSVNNSKKLQRISNFFAELCVNLSALCVKSIKCFKLKNSVGDLKNFKPQSALSFARSSLRENLCVAL